MNNFIRARQETGTYCGPCVMQMLRWWDDRLDKDESGKTVRVVEERLIFLVTKAEDTFPASLGMEMI